MSTSHQNLKPVFNVPPLQKTAQDVFDKQYVTSSEIMKILQISRAGFLYGRRAGKIGEPISLNDGRLLVWDRKQIAEQVNTWRIAIAARKLA